MLHLLLSALIASAALDQATAALAAGNLDGVLFALQPADAVQKDEGRQAARVLLDAARLAQARGDAPLSLQLAQMGLHRDPQSGALLQLLGEQSLRQTELKLAVEYGKRWVQAEPQSEEARQFLARAEARERSWEPPDLERRTDVPYKRARSRRGSRRQVSSAAAPAGSAGAAAAPLQAAPSDLKVTLYASAACKECKPAREWLRAQGVSFVEKDVALDARAARELSQKRLRHRNSEQALPVIDAGGVLVQGFNTRALRAALAR